MSRLAAAVFAVLVLATFGAFFVAQRLKSTPAVVQGFTGNTLFSPNRDGRLDKAEIAFTVRRDDTLVVTMVDEEGEQVARIARNREVGKGRRVRLEWDGRGENGRRVADGTYFPRIVLKRAGRSVTSPRGVVLDTTPPQPKVLDIGPESGPGPELLPRPDGEPVTIRFSAPGLLPDVDIWRTSPGVRRITGTGIDELASLGDEEPPEDRCSEVCTARWSGRRRGRNVAPGTFAVVVRSRDRAGNVGSSVPGLEDGLRPGLRAAGRAGVTVRYLAAQPPAVPVGAGRDLTVAVDARSQPWRWSLRRVGAGPSRLGRRAEGGPFTLSAPGGESGLFLFEARTATRSTRVPVAIDDRDDHSVLVVLPSATWQGRNPVDDDGDGLPDTLELGRPVALERVYAGDGLPVGLTENEAPLLMALDRERHRYDLTTDAALAAGRGPKLEGHRGVLLAGDTVWLTDALRRRLRAFVAGGGTLASFGTGSLRREARLEPGRLLDPTPPARDDLFGARIGPVERGRIELSILEDDGALQLFAGGPGLFPGVRAWEPTERLTGEARELSSAVTPAGDKVIMATRFGRGVVVRTGVPGFATRVRRDRASFELVERIWTLLRTG